MAKFEIETITDRFIPEPEVLKITSWSRNTLYRRVKTSEFLSPIKISERRKAWLESEVTNWFEQKIARARS
ncbi:MAG: helix-turn-helix transcriptional regulator [Methyloligellaceae bacterium]